MQSVNLSTAQISFIDRESPVDTAKSADKYPILLVHGFASSINDNWLDTHWIKSLSESGYRVIALDNRGHGKSQKFYSVDDYSLEIMAGDAIQLLDYLEIDRVHVMGYSMGSRISSVLAMNHPDRVGSLILGGNGYGMIEGTGNWDPVYDGLLADSIDGVTDLRARAFRRFADRTGSDRKALAACLMGIRQLFTEEQFAQIKNQVLVAIGSEDDIAGSGQKLADLMGNARFFSIPGRDHMRATADKVFKSKVVEFLHAQ
jgi:pimeloyl-ACP methyl ester carboxylesterase